MEQQVNQSYLKVEEMRKEIKELTDMLVFLRDDVVFGNHKHVEKINDVLNKKSVKRGV
jgi:hypothetical protein